VQKSKKEQINLSLSFEHLLSFLFGYENHYSETDIKTNAEWRKILLKITNAIYQSILQNVSFTDEYQKNELCNVCTKLKSQLSSSKTINQTNHDIILGFTKIVFHLLGRMPYNWDKKNANRADGWRLNDFRTLGYSQNFKQKANLIIHLSEYTEYNQGMPTKQELLKKLYENLKGNEMEFVQWFKDTYPTNYLKIF
jgi:hypothetical protein